MANPLDRRRNLLDNNDYKSKFDYKEFDIINGDELFLIDLEQKIKNNQVIFVKVNLEIGNLLVEAQNRLKEYGTDTFMKWYENLGFNKDSVSYFLKRYELSLFKRVYSRNASKACKKTNEKGCWNRDSWGYYKIKLFAQCEYWGN